MYFQSENLERNQLFKKNFLAIKDFFCYNLNFLRKTLIQKFFVFKSY